MTSTPAGDDPHFDSVIVIDALNSVAGAYEELGRYSLWQISRIAWIEVLAGAVPEALDETLAFLGSFVIVEVDERIARRAAELRQSTRLKLPDAVILASAQVNHRILVTRNTKDFPANMPGVRVPYTLQES